MKVLMTLNPISLVLLLLIINQQSIASDDHDSHDSHEEKVVTINEAIAHKFGVRTAVVSAGIISQQLKVYGKTVNDPSQISHVRARFPGTVASVKVQIGDTVQVGDTLAYVESNESLNSYPIKAMIAGVVISRHANPGEMALNQVLFTLANFDQVWAELQIFPGQLSQVKAEQKVRISGLDKTADSTIKHIIPSQDDKPYSIARVPIDNELHDWSTGLLVSGQVVICEFEAPIVIAHKAIQVIENKPMVFIKKGDVYEAHSVQLGRSDGRFTEVLSGINLGDDYVTESSYLIKADIEKSGAAHDH